MGTRKESFIELTERINRTTGGVSVYPFTSSVKGSPEPVAFLMVRAPPAGRSEVHPGSVRGLLGPCRWAGACSDRPCHAIGLGRPLCNQLSNFQRAKP